MIVAWGAAADSSRKGAPPPTRSSRRAAAAFVSPSRRSAAVARQIFVALFVARGALLPALGIDPRSDAGRETTLLATFGNPGIFPLLLWNEVCLLRPVVEM